LGYRIGSPVVVLFVADGAVHPLFLPCSVPVCSVFCSWLLEWTPWRRGSAHSTQPLDDGRAR
jgi:hypothetical protein